MFRTARTRSGSTLRSVVVASLLAASITLIAPGTIAQANPAGTGLVISQVYGGGGNSGAQYTNDFIEIFNPTSSSISLAGMTLQYASATGTGNFGGNTGQITTLAGTLAAGQYLLVEEGAGAGSGASLPTPDITDPTPIAMSASAGKVVLANTAVSLGCNGGSTPCGPSQLALIVDLVGYGGANFFEGAAAPGLSNTTAAFRADDGCTDTDNNAADFSSAAPAPRNTASPANPCSGGVADPVINEFVANHTGADTEAFVEVRGAASTDYSGYTVLEIEGDGAGGVIDAVLPVATTNAGGYWVDPEDMENGTLTIILVEGFDGSAGDDLDTNDDGTFDSTPWTRIVDDVAVSDGGASDVTYSTTVLAPGFAGSPFTPGGASRIPDGTDTNTIADWVLNDFDGFGFPGFVGSQAIGEAVNTPGATNEVITVISDPIGVCGDPSTLIHAIQGSGLASPDVGNIREIEGVVVGDFQGSTGLNGFNVQEEDSDIDADPLTSEGIFVFDGGFGVDVSVGDVVRVRGTVAEFFGLTEITSVAAVIDCGVTDTASAATVTLPVSSPDAFETTEGMAVEFPQELFASGNFTQARFGEVDLSVGAPLDNPTNVAAPGAAANAVSALNNRSRIQLDDGSNLQNPLPLPPYLGAGNTLRTGDSVEGVSAVMSYAFGVYEIHPTAPVTFTRNNERPDVPVVGGSMTVAAYNVLNFFTTIDNAGSICGPDGDQGCRGADTASELVRQRDKIVAALAELDADVVGLMEIENPRSIATVDAALDDLVNGPTGLNSVVGAGTYDYIDTGTIGTDAIKVALIYKPANVTPVGAYAILDSSVDPAFIDTLNRPALAQTFQENGTDDLVTVAVNHLKSKGSACDFIGDPDTGDGQGNCNATRTAAATALATWLSGDPTGSGSTDSLIVGDLNSYAMEDPIVAIESAGYTDLVKQFVGTGFADGAYSYNFFSESGYLDHALASPSALGRVTGAGFWHVNADEPSGLDYNNFNQPGLYNPDPYRSSDHDPIVVGVCEATAPVVDVSVTPDALWPPNHKYRDVAATVTVTDADPNAAVTLVSVTSNEPDSVGPGDMPNDIVIVDDVNFRLRAERLGGGTGRVYTVTYDVTDACGNSTTATATVTVPHDQGT